MRRPPAAILALCVFFDFAATMSGLACAALLFPGSPLGVVWRLKPDAHAQLLTLGYWAVALMGIVSLGCALAAVGLLLLAEWGRRIAIGVLAVNLIGDFSTAVYRGEWLTLIGVPISGALMAYLLSPRVRKEFSPKLDLSSPS